MEIITNAQFENLLNRIDTDSTSVFVTGRAGTGKSTFLNFFRSKTRKNIVVLAPTGVAAINVKGQTIHSFFGFKPDVTVEKAAATARKAAKEVYESLEILIVDEISMVRADLLDCMDEFLRTARKSFLPFGGVQVVFIGDLFQLPPVVSSQDKELLMKDYASPFFFSADVMQNFQIEIIHLEKVYRQTDQVFVELLNRVRDNTVTQQDILTLNSRVDELADYEIDEKLIVYLTTTNALAATVNSEHMKQLNVKEYAFKGKLTGDFDRTMLPTDEVLVLKIGAQVMMIQNDQQGRWVNGTIAKVVSIEQDKDGERVIVEMADGTLEQVDRYSWDMYQFSFDEQEKKLASKVAGTFAQFPLKLAWAITIHKSQGKTFDKVIIDFGNGAFAPGQVYVALSRCRTFEGITLRSPIRRRDIWTDKNILEFFTTHEQK